MNSGYENYPSLRWFKYGFILNEGGHKVIDFNTSGCLFRIALYFHKFYIQFGIMKFKPYFIFRIHKYEGVNKW